MLRPLPVRRRTVESMNTEGPQLPSVKFHASLNVSDLGRSVAFYRVLLGQPPATLRADYAKFEPDEPALVLSLIPARSLAGGNLNHLGIRVCEAAELVAIQHRLEAAGFRTQREEGVECCHSRQTKFWVSDPDQALWEIYVMHEDESGPDPATASIAIRNRSFAQDVPRPRVIWQHRLSEAIPTALPHADNSVHEVVLEGTFNQQAATVKLQSLLADAWRALRPGGEIRIHGLTGDHVVPDGPLNLPGPAAAVERVPSHLEPLRALESAGFVELRFEKLSEKVWFTVGGTGLRETLLTGRKPGHRPAATGHIAIHLGPMASVTDDFGNVFPRGVRVGLNIHDWQALKRSPLAGQFLLLEPSPT